jgi:ferredoxin
MDRSLFSMRSRKMLNTQDYLKILVEDIHSTVVAAIDQNRCLHCGNCVPVCPAGAIAKEM